MIFYPNCTNKLFLLCRIFCYLFTFFFLFSCKKYLDKKPIQSVVTPSSLNDLQALLDKYNILNQNAPQELEALADNYYVTDATYTIRSVNDRLNYIWDARATELNNWSAPYTKPIYNANVVIDQLPNIQYTSSEKTVYNTIFGSALFIRAFAFWEVTQMYCRPYTTSASSDLGIVLRLNSNITEVSVRSTVQQTYDQIVGDLKRAIDFLPETSLYPTRPNKIAAYGTLARVYLSMRDYINAGIYANLYLAKKSDLMDYNTLSPTKSPVFPLFNKEVVFYNRTFTSNLVSATAGGKIDSTLFRSYVTNDLRRALFFKANTGANAGTYGFQGGYEGSAAFVSATFDGICTDEMFLVRSEASARSGNKDSALNDLNRLLITRWKTGTFIPFSASTASEALSIILDERRKELVYRGLRWTDVRRLNLESANITLKRVINNITYTLPPNDPRSVLLIPQEILNLTSLQQNPR